MPDFEFEFNQQDKDLVVSQNDGTFGETDYIRLTIYPTEAINNIVDLPEPILPSIDKIILIYLLII